MAINITYDFLCDRLDYYSKIHKGIIKLSEEELASLKDECLFCASAIREEGLFADDVRHYFTMHFLRFDSCFKELLAFLEIKRALEARRQEGKQVDRRVVLELAEKYGLGESEAANVLSSLAAQKLVD